MTHNFAGERHILLGGRVIFRLTSAWVALELLFGAPLARAQTTIEDLSSRTSLAVAAKSLTPGHFVRLQTRLPVGVPDMRELLRVQFPDGRKLAIHGWSDTGHWDAARQKIFYLGMRRFKKFIVYDAPSNLWQEIGWNGSPPPIDEKIGHAYGRNALDRKRGHFYHLSLVNKRARGLFRYLVDDDRWERLPDLPSAGYPSVAALSVEWHPGLDALVVLDPSSPGRRLWTFDGSGWHEQPRSTVNGYHSHLQYNDVSGDVLMAGGNRSPKTMQLFERNGKLRSLPDSPFPMTLGVNDLTYDPQSGRYLYIRSREQEIWELPAKTTKWRRVIDSSSTDWPLRPGSLAVPIPVESLGVVFFLHENGPYLYRHDPHKCERTSCPETMK